ncbi:MAG: hypothetical protein CMJ31_02260 [Phycisphaerae bacterium]|nr:hypothetical protein [Phycisphaerae bacterium]
MPRPLALVLVVLTCFLAACSPPRNRVIVLGMIHGEHRTSGRYQLSLLREALVGMAPDAIVAEIPPSALEDAQRQFRENGVIREGRVAAFPEYTDVVFPLQSELGFDLVPAAGWTSAIAGERRDKLARWQVERPEETAAVEAGFASVDERIAQTGEADDNPYFIHTDAYDNIIRAGVRPYNDLFNDDLGHGGWDNINAAHYVFIRDALDRRRGRKETIVIMFGAWHKYWILDRLKERARMEGDIELVDPKPYFESAFR